MSDDGPAPPATLPETASHALRTPLNAIHNWTVVLERRLGADGRGDPLLARALDGIRAGVAEQARLIDALFDDPDASLAALVDGAIARVAPLAAACAVHVARETLDGFPAPRDEPLSRAALDALLSAAVRAAARGGALRVDATRNDGRVVVRVHGAGDAFAAAARAANEDDDATAALRVARVLVEGRGGRVEVDARGVVSLVFGRDEAG